ncbi:hypothetical protein [Sphingopyxis panaciterrulae]|uniref:Putative membrane protein YdjX (TVP38/TMEM64 family) n=1 Tax=Sphingopyxis panaciterrulae TaxID=462372 RepID=A0A7W9ER80_9SPHN|nr:hypothetical protein [Sphingopyxis panaciterrulae]MBB5705616.1 putative membrane protein YdjX (TVP38/TMEM64 family) [Sphingopyxis panaciterrulae]
MTGRAIETDEGGRRVGCWSQFLLLLAFVIPFTLTCVLIGLLLRQAP